MFLVSAAGVIVGSLFARSQPLSAPVFTARFWIFAGPTPGVVDRPAGLVAEPYDTGVAFRINLTPRTLRIMGPSFAPRPCDAAGPI
jgi:hypothetical protein